MKNRILLIGVAAVALVGIWFVGLWSPQKATLKSDRSKESATVLQHRNLQAELVGLRSLQRRLPSERAAMAAAVAGVPTSPAVDTMVDQVAHVAAASGVTWSNETQTLAVPAAASGPSSLALTLVVSGTPAGIADFLHSVQQLPRVIVVTAVSYAAQPSGETAQITAKAIYDPAPLPALPGPHAGQ